MGFLHEHDVVLVAALNNTCDSKENDANINMEHNQSHDTKIHRLSSMHLLLMSLDLAGDSRDIASASFDKFFPHGLTSITTKLDPCKKWHGSWA